ncbi:MAG TPA: SRPBCC domain-containing protein [bacterium]
MAHPKPVRLVRQVPAPQKAVFEAWLDPKRLARFMIPAPGMGLGEVRVDPRVGGKFRIEMIAGETHMPHDGEYLEIERHRRLVFTWLSAHTGESRTVVTLTFEELGPRNTRVTLEHVGLPTEEAYASHEGGWTHILEVLVKELAA